MEPTRSQPVFITNIVNEYLVEQEKEEGCEEWQELEQFWGEEKHRLSLQEDSQINQIASSLEEHFLHDAFLNEPEENKIIKNDHVAVTQFRTIKGHDLKDIPTTYTINGFKPHELIVIGTCVDKEILPGFRYKVRKNLTEEYLFEGKAKYLLSIGLGYGKRLTFEGDTLNENENYFWSDSRVHGYAFLSQAISNEDVYNILDTKTGKEIGRVLINNPSVKDDVVLVTTVGEKGYVEKEVKVNFTCDVILKGNSNGQNIYVEDIAVKGKATLVRENMSSKAKVSQIVLEDFVLDSCLLFPEE